MTNAQHTAGPWQAEWSIHDNQGTHGWHVFAPDYVDLEGIIADIPDSDKAEANARLIAAAPELLEALQRLLAAHDADVEAGSLIAAGNGNAAEQARAAIAKATNHPAGE